MRCMRAISMGTYTGMMSLFSAGIFTPQTAARQEDLTRVAAELVKSSLALSMKLRPSTLESSLSILFSSSFNLSDANCMYGEHHNVGVIMGIGMHSHEQITIVHAAFVYEQTLSILFH